LRQELLSLSSTQRRFSARFVAQNRGAQFSLGGVLKGSLKSTQPGVIIHQFNGLLASEPGDRRADLAASE